jgi:protein-L-isoaspartate(D-aspartate) O-methyltransferase
VTRSGVRADRAAALSGYLAGLEGIDPDWAAAFARVPREVFVPAFYPSLHTDDPAVSPRLCDGSNIEQRPDWLDAVYQDRSLVTQCALTPGTTDLWQSTSSSTRPSLMARMLTLLHTHPDDTAPQQPVRVLEIGTGTGYNTALLCQRLGAANIASVDLDPGLVEQARSRLAGLGHEPVLVAGDGSVGVADRAPYDRILATCAVAAIPTPWIEQLRPGGLIVADVRGGLASSLLVARRDDHTTVSGRFLAEPGHFMWLRRELDNPLRDGGSFATHIDYGDAEHVSTPIESAVLDDPDFRFLLQLVQPRIDRIWSSRRAGALIVRIAGTGGSWIELDPVAGSALHAGPSDLLGGIERAVALWHQHQHPEQSRLGITQGPGGCTVWLDSPEHPLTTRCGDS